jgi:polysaccharide export outer membrane protein
MKLKNRFVLLIALLLMGTLFSSCATAPPPASPTVPTGDYLLGPEDIIDVSVWKEEDLSKEVTVRPDGKISLPLIGDIRAEGLSAEALGEQIKQALTDYVDAPTVTVTVVAINSLEVFIQGEVNSPGRYDLRSNYTVLQALSLAGGFTEWAKRDEIVILRRQGGQVANIPVNYEKIISGEAPQQNIFLKRGDTIVVP